MQRHPVEMARHRLGVARGEEEHLFVIFVLEAWCGIQLGWGVFG